MPEVNAYIEQGNRVLGALGYTEHSRGHAVKVAETAGNLLQKLRVICTTWKLCKPCGSCTQFCDHGISNFERFKSTG